MATIYVEAKNEGHIIEHGVSTLGDAFAVAEMERVKGATDIKILVEGKEYREGEMDESPDW